MILAGRDEGRDLEEGLNGPARMCGRPSTAERVGPPVTCRQANLIAHVLVASRHVDAAIVWHDEHAASDTEEDVHEAGSTRTGQPGRGNPDGPARAGQPGRGNPDGPLLSPGTGR